MRSVIVPSSFVLSVRLWLFLRKHSGVPICFAMLPIDKCMTTLRLLLPEADPKGIPLAEQAIDQLIAAQDGPSRQIRALHMLEEKLTPIWESATGKQLNFLNVLFDYVATSMTTLTRPNTRTRAIWRK
jgi:hypothetical protein